MVRRRTTLGLSQKEAAQCLRVDPGTLARWERGARQPGGVCLDRVMQFLDEERAVNLAANREIAIVNGGLSHQTNGMYVAEPVIRAAPVADKGVE